MLLQDTVEEMAWSLPVGSQHVELEKTPIEPDLQSETSKESQQDQGDLELESPSFLPMAER